MFIICSLQRMSHWWCVTPSNMPSSAQQSLAGLAMLCMLLYIVLCLTWPDQLTYTISLTWPICTENTNCAAYCKCKKCPVQFFNYCRVNLLVWGIIFPKTFRPLIKLLCISRSKYEVHNSMCTSTSHWNINQWTKS